MNTTATHTNLPPGLMDKCLEIVWDFDQEELKALYDGKFILFKELPKVILNQLYQEMANDEEAMAILIEKGPLLDEDRMWLYYKCKCGGFNHFPDLDEQGNTTAEHWECGCNGNCVLHPLFRTKMQVENGSLTARELEVIKALTEPPCLPAKAVAIDLKISEATLKNHKHSIFLKTGVTSIQALTGWAHKYGLL